MERAMDRVRLSAWAVVVAGCMIGSTGAAGVAVERTDAGAKVTTNGQPFAEYLTKSGHQPVIWPIHGPDGRAMTRSYPLGPKLEGEADDHPHHRSLWFNHGEVNGEDFWTEPDHRGADANDNQIVHREFVEPADGKPATRIVTRNDWTSDGQKLCEDVRTIEFGADGNGRWIDMTVELTASEGDLVLGDTKEGSFAVRVPGTMSVESGKGGEIVNSRGLKNEVAWGQPAEWVNYSGPVEGKPAGIVIFDLPDSFRHPTRWHVRTYGLFAANPFGQRDFPSSPSAADARQGEVKLAKGEKLKVHYRVLFHHGELTPRQLGEIYEKYAGKAK
jgi:hypothetical protein